MPTSAPTRTPHARPDTELRVRVRLADGRIYSGQLSPARHRALQFGMLHAHTDGLVEIAAGTRRNGHLELKTRPRADRPARPEQFPPGGRSGPDDWLAQLTAVADAHVARGQEVFVAPAARHAPRGDRDAVSHTRWLWVDIDAPGQLHRLWALLAKRPCHLLVATGGSGGVHAYWRLADRLPGTRVLESSGDLVEPIETAHLRLIHHLGVDQDGRPNVADLACRDRSRVMRLAGTVNYKTGRHAQILEADFGLPAYRLRDLVGEMPDPHPPRRRRPPGSDVQRSQRDAYKRISPPEYFEALAGVEVPARGGLVRCPAPDHQDTHPSCSVGAEPEQGWCCFAPRCGARGAIYDLASVLLGGPTGPQLRGEQFKRARAYVADVLGEQT